MSSQPPSLQPPPPNHFVSPPPPQQHVVSVAMPVSMAMQQQPRLMSMQLPIASHQQTLVYSHPTRASALTEGNPLSTVSLSALPPPSIQQPQVDPQPPPQQVMVRTAPVSQQQIYGSQASSLNSSFPAIFTADNRSIISYSAAPDTSCITAAVGGNYQARKPPQKSDWRMVKKQNLEKSVLQCRQMSSCGKRKDNHKFFDFQILLFLFMKCEKTIKSIFYQFLNFLQEYIYIILCQIHMIVCTMCMLSF